MYALMNSMQVIDSIHSIDSTNPTKYIKVRDLTEVAFC